MLVDLVGEHELALLLARLVDDAVPLAGQADEHALVVVEVGVHAVLEVRRTRDLRSLLALDERHFVNVVVVLQLFSLLCANGFLFLLLAILLSCLLMRLWS